MNKPGEDAVTEEEEKEAATWLEDGGAESQQAGLRIYHLWAATMCHQPRAAFQSC